MSLFCVGDSHVSLFAGVNNIQPVWPLKAQNQPPFLKVFPLGPVLAYNLIQSNTKTGGREKLFNVLQKYIPKGSCILLCFGEIDCRAHLLKQSGIQKRSIGIIVSECVDRYFSVILDVRKLGFKPLIYNSIPSTRLNNINNKDYPTVGNCRERNLVTSLFNSKLKSKCKSHKIGFISTYSYFVDKHGLTNMAYYMDSVHLSQKAMPITLKVLARELGADFKFSSYQFLRYKIVNFFLDLLNAIKKLRRSFLGINTDKLYIGNGK